MNKILNTEDWDYTATKYFVFKKNKVYLFNKAKYIKDLKLYDIKERELLDIDKMYGPSRKWLNDLDGLPITRFSDGFTYGYIGKSKIGIMPEWCDVYSKERAKSFIKRMKYPVRSNVREGEKRYVLNNGLLLWIVKNIGVTLDELNDHLGGEENTLYRKMIEHEECPYEYVQKISDALCIRIDRIASVIKEGA